MTQELTKFANSFFNLEPFDVMFRDLFNSDGVFGPCFGVDHISIDYPVDIKETKQGLQIDIAAVGLEKKDINLKIEDGDTLRVEYAKQNDENSEDERYLRRGIARRAFKFAWKIAPKFNLDKIDASMDKGLLQLKIPVSPEAEPKLIEIK